MASFGEIINEHRSVLYDIIDINHGLFDELCREGTLPHDSAAEIESETSEISHIDLLLDCVSNSSFERQQRFLVALIKTQQVHVKNYIVYEGCQPSTVECDWPLCTTETMNLINMQWSHLIRMIDSVNGLLDELVTVQCINVQHKQRIEACDTDADRGRALLAILKKRSLGDYRKFVCCLENTKQYQALALLQSDLTRKNRPLSEEHMYKLLVNRPALMARMNSRVSLLEELVAVDCITWRHKQRVEEADTVEQRNARLYEIVMRGSEQDFELFVECLFKSNNLGRILLGNGVLIRIAVALGVCSPPHACCGSSVPFNESENSLQHCACLSKLNLDECTDRLPFEAASVTDDADNGFQLIAIDTQTDIALYYLCSTLAGTLRLNESLVSGQLKASFNRTFASRLGGNRQREFVDSLHWNMSEYFACIQYMYQSSGLSVFSDVYLFLQECQNFNVTAAHFPLEKFPFELFEAVLIQAVRQLFTVFIRSTPQASSFAFVALSAVSYLWWQTLTCRRQNKHKRLLRRYYRHICRPFKCTPGHLSSLCAVRNVTGMAEISGKLYVACWGSGTVQAFNSNPPFSRLEDITILGLNAASDIVACTVSSHLFIADRGQSAIWQVNMTDGNGLVDQCIPMQRRPQTLSTKARRLLVTPEDGEALLIYDDEGVLSKHIELTDNVKARHAVETSRGTLLVAHCSKRSDDQEEPEHSGVSEVDFNGQIIRSFNTSRRHSSVASLQYVDPSYVALDGSSHVIVADCRSQRIIVLTEDLQLKRVLINSINPQPTRLFMSQQTNFLFIAKLHSYIISSYVIR